MMKLPLNCEAEYFSDFLTEVEAKELCQVLLKSGSVIVMGDYCQSRYEHSLPKNPDCKESRINITFREANFK